MDPEAGAESLPGWFGVAREGRFRALRPGTVPACAPCSPSQGT